jgi:hypothetical protein
LCSETSAGKLSRFGKLICLPGSCFRVSFKTSRNLSAYFSTNVTNSSRVRLSFELSIESAIVVDNALSLAVAFAVAAAVADRVLDMTAMKSTIDANSR